MVITREAPMSDVFGMARQLASQSMRVGWYLALNRLVEQRTSSLGARSSYHPLRPVPSTNELLAELGQLLFADAMAVREGTYPPMSEAADTPRAYLERVRAMLDDLPSALARRANEDAASAKATPMAQDLPEYYTQDFHFQTGGYLTEDSARLYDVQVETLFLGAAGPMRRAVLGPIIEAVRGRDQRQLALLDVACGTGRFLRQVRQALPAIGLTGLDLSTTYLAEAERQFSGLRGAAFTAGNAEAIPVAAASQDIVTATFLYHELPPEVRRQVTAEIARVLQPGGTFVFLDSLQMGDRPGWDGLLEAFPVRFHEPYFRHYSIDDLEAQFTDAGLAKVETRCVFLAKMMVRRKSG